MVKLIRYHSTSDVITNSSSEVYLMSAKAAEENFEIGEECITITYYPDLESVKEGWIPYDVLSELNLPTRMDSEQWREYCDTHKEEIERKLVGTALVDIEDHMDYDEWCTLCDTAHDYSFISYSNR